MKSTDRLLVISSTSALPDGDQTVIDRKFVTGMERYADLWPGPVTALLHRGSQRAPFSEAYNPNELSFDIKIFPKDRRLQASDLLDAETVLCSGDNTNYLHLAEICRRLNKKIFYIIENVLETRRQITWLDANKSWPRKIYSMAWLVRQEIRRRNAFLKASGLQANGYPAHESYKKINKNTLLYLDSRITKNQMASDKAMAVKASYLSCGGPVRLIHSGRLEPIKGSQDLISVSRALNTAGVDFTLDIFGDGSLAKTIADDIVSSDLSHRVRMHGSVDFDSVLIPFARENADIYLSCHRQSDPSCSYLENMGCGLAVIGYNNRMLSGLLSQTDIGRTARLGDTSALSATITEISQQRSHLIGLCQNALNFARKHSFEEEFTRRIRHLKS